MPQRLNISFLLGLSLSLLPLPGLAKVVAEEVFESKGVRTRLLSEAKVIAAGQTFTVALTLDHESGFHTYWKNPGTVGMPTSIKWELPEGFRASALIWQIPERSKMFKYDVYGYEGNATILTEITAPEGLSPGTISLEAKASWMACSDTGCNPGYHTFRLHLPIGEKSLLRPEASQLIDHARSRLPKSLPTLRASAKTKGEKIQLIIEGDALDQLQYTANLHFFSSLNHYRIEPIQKIRRKKNSLFIMLPKADYAPDQIRRVEGILRGTQKDHAKRDGFIARIQAQVK
jgi:DsbC/DsbD-like thiol-disulfide interchange protein